MKKKPANQKTKKICKKIGLHKLAKKNGKPQKKTGRKFCSHFCQLPHFPNRYIFLKFTLEITSHSIRFIEYPALGKKYFLLHFFYWSEEANRWI